VSKNTLSEFPTCETLILNSIHICYVFYFHFSHSMANVGPHTLWTAPSPLIGGLLFIHNLQKPQHKASGPLPSTKLTHTRQHLIKGERLACLLKNQSTCPSLVRQLSIFLDDNQLIHGGEQTHNQNLPSFQFPYQPTVHSVNWHEHPHQTPSWRCEHHCDSIVSNLLDTSMSGSYCNAL